MAALTLVITDAGRAALVNAQHNGTNAVQIGAVGISPTQIAASAATTALPGEVKRVATISGNAVAANVIHLIVRDESADAYTLRSFALYLADGTLFAAFGQADPVVQKTAGATMLLAIDVTLADIAAAQITFGNTNFIDPPATTATPGVVRLSLDAEAVTGTDATVAVTPRGLWAAMAAKLAAWGSDVWRASNDGAGSGLDADLLDGHDGSWYSNINARLGYTAADAGGQTFTGAIRRDAQFYMDLKSPTLPLLNFDANQYVVYDRNLQQLSFRIAGQAFNMQAGGMTINGFAAWHAGNDGAGSGCDADLLDGQEGSWYSNIVARLGYQPADAAGQTFAGPIRRDAQFYMDLSSPILPVLNFDANQYIVYNRSLQQLSFRIAGQAFNMQAGGMTINGFAAWHAGNDGSGSGLDADLLDGLEGSAYDRIVSFGANDRGAWRLFSDGRMEMYGSVSIGSGAHFSFTAFEFPAAFPTACQGIDGNARGRCNANWAPINVVFEWDTTHNATCIAHSGNVDQAIDPGKSISWRAWGVLTSMEKTMPDTLTTDIGAFDKATRTVPVTFTLGDIVHRRPVNACLDAKGRFDATATAERVDQVAAGVAVKIAAGAITNPPPEPVQDAPAA